VCCRARLIYSARVCLSTFGLSIQLPPYAIPILYSRARTCEGHIQVSVTIRTAGRRYENPTLQP
jgi:hypothetical protein